MRLADDLRLVAAITADGEAAGPVAAALIGAVSAADDVTAIAAVHALGAVSHPSVDEALVGLVVAGDEPFAGHAAWTLAARSASPLAFDALEALRRAGGFSAMLAERTLRSWGRLDRLDDAAGFFEPSELIETDRCATGSAHERGIVVIQPFLHARIDRAGSSLGVGDAGGIASLLRSLGTALGELDEIDEVVTVTRRHAGERAGERLAAGHMVVRLDVGADGAMPWREAWVHRVAIERQMLALGRVLGHRRVVWHLRMADVGTLAAASAARRLGQPVVFTAAPDPHIVIDALQDDGRLDRDRFAIEDAAAQFWFRARMVERLAAQADRVVVLPRPTIQRELVDLVGLDAADVRDRVTVVPEGVDVTTIDEAITARAATPAVPQPVQAILDRLPPERRHLPWLLTVGRLHPSKGPQRVVEAVAGHATLADDVNVVIVGGSLNAPSADEQSTIERIRRAALGVDPALVTLTGNLPPREVADLMVHTAASGGVYVGAADKEEFGLAIVEAMAAGAVVVAPARGGPRSYVDDGDTGVLCDTLSVDALRDAIERALAMASDDQAAQRSDRVRATVRRELGIGSMASALAEVYRSATADRDLVAPAGAASVPIPLRRGAAA
jgi:glycosyltransferase involved in cell wall biosynthesis